MKSYSAIAQGAILLILLASLGLALPARADTIPTFVAVSAIAASTGADVTLTLPATWEPDDVFLVLGVVRDQDDTVTITGYTAITGTPFDRNTVSRYWLFWKRATTSESNPVFDKSTATGDTYAMLAVYRLADLTGTPFDVFGTPGTGTSDPATCTAVTTVSHDALVIAALAGEDNNNAAVTTTATYPRAGWVEHYAASATGTDGAVSFSEFGKSGTGSTGTVSVDFDVANPVGWGCMVLSLAPHEAAGGASHNSLVTLTAEGAGANCQYGGTKVQSGLDNGDGGGTADDGTLQAGEVDATSYVCNGAPGANGADGYNSLVATTAEAPGGNCATGGIKITSGLDNGDGGGTARNGVLESGEVDATSYVCNGAAGATGAQGPQGPQGTQGPEGPIGDEGILALAVAAGALLFIVTAPGGRRIDA